MGETKNFQICHQGDLTLELAGAMRRLGAEPNFESSWQVRLPESRTALLVLRYLRRLASPDSILLVAGSSPRSGREFLLVRHSVTAGYDYSHLHNAFHAYGELHETLLGSTFLIRSRREQDSRQVGETLSTFCPDDALMVMGVSEDIASWSSTMLWPGDEAGASASRSHREAGRSVAM